MTAEQRAAIAKAVLARATADGTQVTVDFSRQGLTRFTHDTVNQNIDQTDTSVHVRAIVDGRTGIAATNAFDEAALADVVARATAIARLAPRETIAPQLAGPADPTTPAGAFVPATAAATPDDRARIAGAMFAGAGDRLWSSGYAMTATRGVTIANSNGASLSFDGTDAGANVKMNGPDSTGFAEYYSRDAASLDGGLLGREAARIARETREPSAADPGDWTVILAPAAAGELLRYLTYHFSAEAFSDGSSFIAGKLGTPVLGANVTIRDDFSHPLNPGMPFDFEGFPTARVTLIDRGVAGDIVTDSTWSAKRLARPKYRPRAARAEFVSGPQSGNTVVGSRIQTARHAHRGNQTRVARHAVVVRARGRRAHRLTHRNDARRHVLRRERRRARRRAQHALQRVDRRGAQRLRVVRHASAHRQLSLLAGDAGNQIQPLPLRKRVAVLATALGRKRGDAGGKLDAWSRTVSGSQCSQLAASFVTTY